MGTISITAAPFTSAQAGDWNTGATWTGGNVPTAGSNVTINHAVTLAAPLTNTGTVTISSGASFAVAAAYTNSGTTTVAGTFQINTGGSVLGTGLVFNAASLLKYNVNANYNRSNEWTASSGTVGTTAGYPFHVQLSNNSVLNFPNGSTTTRAMAGDLTIDNGSALYQDFSSGSAALIVGGSAILNGNLSLGAASGGDITVGGNWTRAATGAAFNNNGRAVIFNGSGNQTVTSGGGTESFAFLTVAGSGTLQLSSSPATSVNVTSANGLTLSSTNATSTINLNGQTLTVSGGGNLALGTGTRRITSASSAVFAVSTNALTVSGTGPIIFGDNVSMQLSNGMNFGSALSTIGAGASGTLQINAGGFVDTNAPRYASGSTLRYNTGTTYGRGAEWTAATGTVGTTVAYPFNVQVSNSSTLNYPNGGSVGPLAIGGSLTVDSGASLYMDFGSPGSVGALTVNGSVALAGNLSLGNVSGGDLNLKGNWTRTGGAFTPNGRAVTFSGSTAQTISGAAATDFAFVIVNNSSGTGPGVGVVVAQAVGVNNQLTLTTGGVDTTGGSLTINATAPSAISGGAAASYVNGPLRRTLPANLVSGSTYVFPVGKGGVYAPFELVNPTTNGGGLAVVSSETFPVNTGGSSPTLVLNTNRYWETTIPTNSSSLTNTSIRLTDPSIGSANILASSATLSGTYTSIGGTVVSTSILSNTLSLAGYLQYLVMANSSPALTASPSSLSGFGYIVGTGPSAAQTYNVSGLNLTPSAGNITVTGSASYEVSSDGMSYGNSFTIPYTGGTLGSTTVWVRLKAGLASASYNGELVTNAGGGATTFNVTCSGSVTTPTIATTGTLTAFTTDEGTASAAQSFNASGTSLLADIVVTAPTGFEISLSAGGTYTTTLNLTPTANTVASTPIFVRIAAATLAGTPSGNVTLTSTGATTRTVAASGTVRPLAPTVQASAASVTGTGTTTATVSWTRGNGANVIVLMKAGSAVDSNPVNNTAYTANAAFGSGTQIGTGNRVIYSGTATSVAVTALSVATTYHVAVYEFNGTGSNVTYNLVSPALANGATLTAAPTTPTFASVTSTGFTVNWAAVTGASGYKLDVATDSGFTSFVAGYNDLSVATNTQAVTGLSPNTAYFARVRALNVNSLPSANSPTGTQTTSQLSAPVTAVATSVTGTSFTANWSAVAGATDYRIDVYRGAADLIISEYLEGSASNKYIEIYNGTPFTVDLTNYEMRLFANGAALGSPTTVTALTGTLASGSTIVLKNNASTIYGGTTVNNTALNFNGDDAIALFKISPAAAVDIIGRIGEDPGTEWTAVGGYSTLDKTLRRKSTVAVGVSVNPSAGFPTLATEWDVFATDTVSGLGTHTGPTPTFILTNSSTGGATSLAVTGLTPGTQYFYVVRATSTNSTSANSDTRSVTTNPSTVTLTGTPTAFSTTYGVASAAQTFPVTGSDLVANAVATAPAGYEVSIDGTTYGSTATFTPSSGSVSGTLSVRLAALTTPSDALGTTLAFASSGAVTQSLTVSGTVNPATPTIAVTGSSTFTYDSTPQGPTGTSVTGVSGGISPGGAVSIAYEGTGGTTYGPSATQPTNAGSYTAIATIAADPNYTTASSSAFGFSIGQRTLTITADGKVKAKGASDPALTYQSTGLVGGDMITGALTRSAGETPGSYAITQGTLSASANYALGFTGATLVITGPLGVADSATKPTDSTAIKIPISTLLSNDTRVTNSGAVVGTGLSITGLAPGTGNGVSLSGAFVFFTPNPSTSSETFTYTVSDGVSTDTVTVTVTTYVPNPLATFQLNVVNAAAASFNSGNNTTSKVIDFIAVPGQSIIVEYSLDMTNWFQANGGAPVSSGASGSFFVTLTGAGNLTGIGMGGWDNQMFFRGRVQ